MPADFCTLREEIAADDYRGQRVRLSGWVKTHSVADWSWLWMGVDGAGRALAFDNMRSRPIKGTTPWTRYEVVLDVASEADEVFFGIGLNGAGTVWLDDVALERVGLDVPTTEIAKARIPRNLSFEE